MEEAVKYQEGIGELVERVMFKGVPADQRKVALAICGRYGLDPILKHVVIISGNAYITRDGLLQVAHDSGIPFSITFGEPGERQNPYSGDKDIYLTGTLHRTGFPEFSAGIWFSEYSTGKGAWGSHPAAMHQKVVEVYLLRRGFNVSMTPVEEMSFVPPSEIVDGEVVEIVDEAVERMNKLMRESASLKGPVEPEPDQEPETPSSTSVKPPEQCKEYLRGESEKLKAKHNSSPPTTNQYKLFTGMTAKLAGGDDSRRITWSKEVWGVKESTSELKRRNVEATLDYLAAKKDDDGKYHITNANAQEEFDLIVNAAIQRESVGELL